MCASSHPGGSGGPAPAGGGSGGGGGASTATLGILWMIGIDVFEASGFEVGLDFCRASDARPPLLSEIETAMSASGAPPATAVTITLAFRLASAIDARRFFFFGAAFPSAAAAAAASGSSISTVQILTSERVQRKQPHRQHTAPLPPKIHQYQHTSYQLEHPSSSPVSSASVVSRSPSLRQGCRRTAP